MILPEEDFGKQLARLRVEGFIQEGIHRLIKFNTNLRYFKLSGFKNIVTAVFGEEVQNWY